MTLLKLIALIIISLGTAIQLFGIYSMIKYENFYTRLTISSIIDTAAFILIIVGLMIYKGISYATFKMLFILFLMLLLNPLSTHTLGRGAYMSNYHPERINK